MLAAILQYLRTFRANHKRYGNVMEDPNPRYSAGDRAAGRRHADETQDGYAR